jgi:uncharacterized membrane protein
VEGFARASFVAVGVWPWIWTFLRPRAGSLGDVVEVTFALVCHRMAERVLVLGGCAMPVCSRCAGIFAGLATGAVIAWPAMSLPRAQRTLAVALVLMLCDIVTQDLGLHPPWHAARLATGGLLGYLATATLVRLIRREQGRE